MCNKNLILLSKNCGCFYCGKIFDKSLIVDYVEDMNDLTALCPFCGIDSILPDSKVKLSKDILESMYKVWF
ncbi:MAG: cytoplasmic protein [Clostridia bacterium]|nr:cytoplasmic protein [Clostridia bacterium]